MNAKNHFQNPKDPCQNHKLIMPRYSTKLEKPQGRDLECKDASPGIKGSLDNYCVECHTQENLMLCSQCNLFSFCKNKSCMERRPDFISSCGHFLCKLITQELEEIRNEESTFYSTTENDILLYGAPENPFLNSVGDFDMIDGARYYLSSLESLYKLQAHVAHFTNSKRAWLASNETSMELLRLCRKDKFGARFMVPLQLLHLNRDDECYLFCKHWIMVANYSSSDEFNDYREELHRNSKKGDFLFPGNEIIVDGMIYIDKNKKYPEQACRFNDIIEIFPRDRHPKSNWSQITCIVAICLIKMRIIAIAEASKRLLSEFQSTDGGKAIEQVQTILEDFVVGPEMQKADIPKQKAMLFRLFDIIDSTNKSILPAILNPEPLKQKKDPPTRPSEAYNTVVTSLALFQSIDYGMNLLRQRYGDKPSYSLDLLR